jgi:hypothetical protein
LVLEALSIEFRVGCPWELLYADDLVIISESLEDLLGKLKSWKAGMEAKGLRVNMGKTKVMVSGLNLHTLKGKGRCPCAVCRAGVGSNSILCVRCNLWTHKKCSGLRGNLKQVPNFTCKRCTGHARPIDMRPFQVVKVDEDSLDVVDAFCYLGDMLSAGGGSELSSCVRIKTAWGKFRQLLPILSNHNLPYATRGKIYNSCVRSAMLHASECWPISKPTLNRLTRNDRCMIRWMCGAKSEPSTDYALLLNTLGIPSLDTRLRANRLRWFGHVERNNGWLQQCRNIVVPKTRRRGRPLTTWDDTVKEDIQAWHLSAVDPI